MIHLPCGATRSHVMSRDRIGVALLAPLPPPIGGIGTWALRVKEAMPKECEITFVNEGLVGGREFFGEKSKKKLSDEWRRCQRIWRDLESVLSTGEIDIVHANIPAVPGGILRELRCAQIAHAHNCKFIVHWHSTVSQSVSSRVTEALLKRICDVADAIIVLNEKSRSYVEARTNTPVYLLPNFVSDEEMIVRVSSRKKIETCLYVGGVCEDKGIYEFLELAERFPDITFKAIGKIEGGVTDAAPKNVVLTGPLDHSDIKDAMVDADIFIFLTHYRHEGFSVALTEAMAAGLPCIATDWAANKDMIGQSGGIIIQCGNVDSACEALRHLESPDVRAFMGRTNVDKVANSYTARVVLNDLCEIYSDVMTRNSARRCDFR